MEEILAHIGDILTGTEDEEENPILLDEVLCSVTKAGLKPSLKKVKVMQREVEYLGFKLKGSLVGVEETSN